MESLPREYLGQWYLILWRLYVFSLRRHLPPQARRTLGRLYGAYVFWRLRPSVTQMLVW